MSNTKITLPFMLGLMALAYIFSVLVRFIWVWHFAGDIPTFLHNGEIMITTNDGYYFANGIKAMLNNSVDLLNSREISSIQNNLGMSYITYALAKFTPFSLETVMLYLPAFISSLIVIPIILIGRVFGMTLLGFFAALLGAITHSYYNRTMIGYYDSDMFALLFPFIILYFVLAVLVYHKSIYGLLGAISIALFPLFYAQGLTVTFATLCMFLGYVLLYERKNTDMYKNVILLFIALIKISILIKIPILIVIYFALNSIKIGKKEFTYIMYIAIASALFASVSTGLMMRILQYILAYTGTGTGDISNNLHFFQVNQTIREAGSIPFATLANRISGHTITFVLATIGYILFIFNHKKFIVSIPLFGLGLFAFVGGLRFTVYAVPLSALGIAYLAYVVAELVIDKKYRYLIVAGAIALAIYPNIKHTLKYNTSPVFAQTEVQSLEYLDSISSPNDYTLTWWDYGYPIWFYSNTHTLIDGAKHNHDNYIISKILNTSSQDMAVNLARITVENYASRETTVADEIFKDKQVNEYLKELDNPNYTLPTKTRDIYFYMPYRMLDIFPTIDVFSNLDLNENIIYDRAFYYKSNRFQDKGNYIYLSQYVYIDKSKNTLNIQQKRKMQSIPLYKMIFVNQDTKGKTSIKEDILHSYGNISVVYLSQYQTFLVVDNKFIDSVYFQMFLFDNYDKELFEKVVSNPYVKIFKLKK